MRRCCRGCCRRVETAECERGGQWSAKIARCPVDVLTELGRIHMISARPGRAGLRSSRCALASRFSICPCRNARSPPMIGGAQGPARHIRPLDPALGAGGPVRRGRVDVKISLSPTADHTRWVVCARPRHRGRLPKDGRHRTDTCAVAHTTGRSHVRSIAWIAAARPTPPDMKVRPRPTTRPRAAAGTSGEDCAWRSG